MKSYTAYVIFFVGIMGAGLIALAIGFNFREFADVDRIIIVMGGSTLLLYGLINLRFMGIEKRLNK